MHGPHVIAELKNYCSIHDPRFTNSRITFEVEEFLFSRLNFVATQICTRTFKKQKEKKRKIDKPLSSAPTYASYIFMLQNSQKPSIVQPHSTVIQCVIEKKEKKLQGKSSYKHLFVIFAQTIKGHQTGSRSSNITILS